MIRIIIAALIIYAIWKLWEKAGARKRGENTSQKSISPGEMVPCDRCGTFVLGSEAIKNGGNVYCSEGCWKGN